MTTGRVTMFLFSAVLASMSLLASAHTEEFFDSRPSPHGGQMRMTGPYHLELVSRDNELLVYLMDHADSELSVNGGSGKATIQTARPRLKPRSNWNGRVTTVSRGAEIFLSRRTRSLPYSLRYPNRKRTLPALPLLSSRPNSPIKQRVPNVK